MDFNITAEQTYSTILDHSPLLYLLLTSLAQYKIAPKTKSSFQSQYDYIIVGAGSAGSTLASRLTEKSCVSVLLLEAGGPPPLLSEVPVLQQNFRGSSIDWQYLTKPQRYTGAALVKRQVKWPSGKGLGGSSILNAFKYIRGNKRNYDNWAANGAYGWSYQEVLPYFLKSEDNTDPEYFNDEYHHQGGPLTVGKSRYQSELTNAIFSGAYGLGYDIVDTNGKWQTGFTNYQGTYRNGQRCSTAKAYLVPAENRTNLDILTHAFVKKINITDKRATGVTFEHNGTEHYVAANLEVIISAGSINSAQLLMLSGIGPKEELDKFNIPVIEDLPVGKNLQDHCSSVINFALDPHIKLLKDEVNDPKNIYQYIEKRTGPLSSMSGVLAMAFLNSQTVYPDIDNPDYQLTIYTSRAEAEKNYGYKDEIFKKFYGPYMNISLFTCYSQVLEPRSIGSVTLSSADPYDSPIIDPNYFSDPRDVGVIVEGMKTCYKIGNSKQMKQLGSKPFSTLFPGCEEHTDDQDKYFACRARSMCLTMSHPVGTTKMGDPNDPTTVVDPELRLKGIDNIRIVDAGIMPTIPSGNTNAPTIMVAEKVADILKETMNC